MNTQGCPKVTLSQILTYKVENKVSKRCKDPELSQRKIQRLRETLLSETQILGYIFIQCMEYLAG